MKATLPDGTTIECTPQELAEVLKALKPAPVHVGPPAPSAIRPLGPSPYVPPGLPTGIDWHQLIKTTGVDSGCACPQAKPGEVMGWGGYCPIHSMTYGGTSGSLA